MRAPPAIVRARYVADAAGVLKRTKRNNPEKAVPRKERKAKEEAAKAAAAAAPKAPAAPAASAT